MVKINGNDSDVSGMTISQYLKTTDYDLKFIAVECNEEIVPKAQYDETVIQNGDVIEVVSFVGGG
ncbi:MAG: sulfur carrier protein ThiS [Ruminococcus sp.]|nr:sulfur carrier protein ThiS [Ruminococcus sp.]